MDSKLYFVYILASKRNGTLYIGLTNNMLKRVDQHKQNLAEGFTEKYNVHRLVYYEQYRDVNAAIKREKQMKKWNRKWKIGLIEKANPQWKDLFDELVESMHEENWIRRSLDSRFRGNDRGAGMTE